MSLPLSSLKVMQDGLRLPCSELGDMLEFVASGGVFDEKSLKAHNSERSSLIAVVQFPDGEWYIRDGLHRTVAIFSGRESKVFFPEEYVIEEFTYEQFDSINLQAKFYTPFDPRTRVRKSDFFDFKLSVERVIKENGDAEGFIRENQSEYSVPRVDSHNIEFISEHFCELCRI